MCKVSVVIPTYKRSAMLMRTLESVFAQTFTDYEVIVVDDGSPDDTRDVLRPLADAGRIRYVTQKNSGQAVARNRGALEARGEYLAFLDDDDQWLPDKLEWQMRELDADPSCALVYGDALFFTEKPDDQSGELIMSFGKTVPEVPDGAAPPTGRVWEAFVQRNYIQSPGQTLIRTEAFRKIDGFDPIIWGTEDYELYIRLAEQGTFLYRNKLALHYRFNYGGVSTSRNAAKMYKNAVLVRTKHLGLLPRLRTFRLWMGNYRFLSQVFGDDLVNATGDAVARGDKKAARSLWLRSVTVRPAFLGQRHTYYLLKNLI